MKPAGAATGERSPRAADKKERVLTPGSRLRHDLRSHLQTVMGYSDLLHEEKIGALNPTQREFLGNIASATSMMLALLDSLEQESGRGGKS
jgi:light-regulated signal transduction histidine kinase (bacteriophytochrome)